MFLLKMFSPKWLLATVFVFLGTAVCIRLGIWQLDRLEARRAFNAQLKSMRSLPALDLNRAELDSVEEMEWRSVEVTGTYDFEHQVALRNQYHDDQYGYHLWTPLLFDRSASSSGAGQTKTAVLVDRGWIPAEGNSRPSDWRKYDEPGAVDITGQIRRGQAKPALGGVADVIPEDGDRLAFWNNGDVPQITAQLPYPALPFYIQPDVNPSDSEPPIPFQPEIELTEGPHFGYALQWFTFATILFIGYPFYLRKQDTR